MDSSATRWPVKFRTKPFEIEAVQFTGDNVDEIVAFVGNEGDYNDYGVVIPPGPGFGLTEKFGDEQTAQVYDKLHSTWVGVKPTDWIIKGQKGEFYPCDTEIFEAKYERL